VGHWLGEVPPRSYLPQHLLNSFSSSPLAIVFPVSIIINVFALSKS